MPRDSRIIPDSGGEGGGENHMMSRHGTKTIFGNGSAGGFWHCQCSELFLKPSSSFHINSLE